MSDSSMLTLAEALKTGRLQDFIAQEEQCVGPVDSKALEEAIKKVLTGPQPKDRTSHFRQPGNSTEK